MGLKAKDKLIVTVLVVLAVVVFLGGRYHDNHVGFTTEKWVNYQGNDRQLIVQDLVDRTMFVGMTRAEVKEQLGEAEEETDAYLTYYVGIPQGIFGTEVGGEKEYLLIEIGEDDVVTASGVMTGNVLPKDSMFRIIGDAEGDGVLYPTEE